jgi:hypothetical protein
MHRRDWWNIPASSAVLVMLCRERERERDQKTRTLKKQLLDSHFLKENAHLKKKENQRYNSFTNSL